MFGRFLAYNKTANLWIAKVGGTIKTKDEAQTIVTAQVDAAKNSMGKQQCRW